MDLQAIWTWGGGAVLLVLSLIKIPKIEINIWGLLGRTIGRSINKELIQKVEKLQTEVEESTDTITHMSEELVRHYAKDEENSMLQARTQLLRFNDEILHNQKHSYEHFNEILEVIDRYEKYCNNHPNFPNNKAKISIQNIKDTYNSCMDNHSFL